LTIIAMERSNRKRKADSLGRIASAVATGGRGAVTGWSTCPLCVSQKRYALGRGIATHLHAVHTPWNPGKAEKKKRKRMAERRRAEQKRKTARNDDNSDKLKTIEEQKLADDRESWEPTQQEIDEWDETVLKIVAELEAKAFSSCSFDNIDGAETIVKAGFDRNGKKSKTYRESLPPFIQAAADGDLNALQTMVKVSDNIRELIDLRDRNLSCAEHWAAGGGHLSCLKFLFALRQEHGKHDNDDVQTKSRRRDGKTCLHYAARNGQLKCLQYLLDEQKLAMDQRSGDGTTPLHMACFGGHVHAVKYLIDKGANVLATNEWGCSAAHWAAMSSKNNNTSEKDAVNLCNLLKQNGVSFVERQKQGHSALHKAAQRLNRHVIEWIAAKMTAAERIQAGLPDEGGHSASEIWLSVGGDKDFAKRMKEEWGW
jgi:ankyrin repeat protein